MLCEFGFFFENELKNLPLSMLLTRHRIAAFKPGDKHALFLFFVVVVIVVAIPFVHSSTRRFNHIDRVLVSSAMQVV